jgi:hypothetical protein
VKGLVFTEFLELVDERYSFETCEQLIQASNLPSGGTYTSVGTYPVQEMVTLVTNLSSLTGTPVPDLLKEFGRHLFKRFVTSFPVFFEGIGSALEFLPRVDGYVHLEVRKLYPDAELPSFSCASPTAGTLVMTYRSNNHLADLAEGLILACIEHFGESLIVMRQPGNSDAPETVFTIRPA